MTDRAASLPLDLVSEPDSTPPGVRLDAVEILNWGTFDRQVWRLDLGGDNALLTGDIGSGKSTLVDAVTSLLVPAQKIAFNKAAGADVRERDLRSYVLGHYKSERGEAGLSAKPVALRDHNNYSVILGRFRNEGYGETVTLAQVFWFKEAYGQPARFYVVADKALSIAEHFSGFGRDIGSLRKRLRKVAHVELFDTFPPYGAAFRRRFGIDSEQALDLFHQTVSMKAVGNLTDFVRGHMLEPFPVEDRIQHMVAHFEDLTRAHEAVLKARAQIERLVPIVTDSDGHAALVAQVEDLRASREALRAFFAEHKVALLDKRISGLALDIAKLGERIVALKGRRGGQDAERDAPEAGDPRERRRPRCRARPRDRCQSSCPAGAHAARGGLWANRKQAGARRAARCRRVPRQPGRDRTGDWHQPAGARARSRTNWSKARSSSGASKTSTPRSAPS